MRIKIMQTIDTTAFVYFPSKFHVRINVRFHSISANKKSPADRWVENAI
ncbi:TPA: hypothetical protein U0631_002156 [Streptococcus suis]|nr:hypothetical protein [Streptococcus suis]